MEHAIDKLNIYNLSLNTILLTKDHKEYIKNKVFSYHYSMDLLKLNNDDKCIINWLFDFSIYNLNKPYDSKFVKLYDNLCTLLHINSNTSSQILNLLAANYHQLWLETKNIKNNIFNKCPLCNCLLKDGILLHWIKNNCVKYKLQNYRNILLKLGLKQYEMNTANRILILKNIISMFEIYGLKI